QHRAASSRLLLAWVTPPGPISRKRHPWHERRDPRQSHHGSLSRYGAAGQTSRFFDWPWRWRAWRELQRSSSLAQPLDAFPVRASLMRLGTPRRDDSPLVGIKVHINDCNFQSVHDANGVDSLFAVIVSVIDPLKRWPFKDPYSIFKPNPVHPAIPGILTFTPSVAHWLYLHNVRTPAWRA